MTDDILYNTNFLNTLFTKEDFSFIYSCDTEIEKLNSQIEEQENKREILVKFINKLDNDSSSSKDAKLVSLKVDSNNIFYEINNNINLLHDLIKDLSDIKQNTVELLISAESKNMPDSKYIEFANEIKKTIELYSNLVDETKYRILFQNKKVDNFIKTNINSNYSVTLNLSEQNIKPNFDHKVVSVNSANIDLKTGKNNKILLISEKKKKVFLPYYENEINRYLEQFPDEYKSFDDVVKREYVMPINYYMGHTVVSRFRESYALIRDRESKSIFEAMKYSFDLMFRYDLNPAIIAACKTQNQLENYLDCLESKKLNEFTDFEIKYEISPLATPKKDSSF